MKILTVKWLHPAKPTAYLALVNDGAHTLGMVPVTPSWKPSFSKARPMLVAAREERPFKPVFMSNVVLMPLTVLKINC